MQWAPSFYLGFGYWMASSKQLYSNSNLKPFELRTDPVESDHTVMSVFNSEGWVAPAWPLLLAWIVVTTMNIFGDTLMTWIENLIPYLRVGDIDLKEDIGNFWSAISAEDRRWSIKEEEYTRENLHGMKIMTDDAFEKLQNVKKDINKKHTLKGSPNYDILRQPIYQ